jgi:hypothetical protein
MVIRQNASLLGWSNSILDRVGISPDASFEEAVQQYRWGNRGEYGDEQLSYKRLVDCDTEHLENILSTQYLLPEFPKRVIIAILRDRYSK